MQAVCGCKCVSELFILRVVFSTIDILLFP